MSTEVKNLSWLDQLDPIKLVEHEKVRTSFIDTYAKIHGVSESEAEMVYEKESTYYKKAVSANDRLKSCTRLTLYSAFLEVAIQGISLQPGSKSLAYLESRSSKVKEVWISTCNLVLTTYGELELRIKSGQIVAMLNPIVVYEGDTFQPRTNQRGEIYVDYAPLIPRQQNAKIIACWVRVVVPGGISDFKWLLQEDIDRLKKCSIPKSGTNPQPNALYSSFNGGIDPGFLEAKTIKHAMRSKGKLKVGDSVVIEGEEEEETNTETTGFAPPAPEAKTVQIVTNPDESF